MKAREERIQLLSNWGFKEISIKEFYKEIDGVQIKWNLVGGHGAFTIDGELTLLNKFSELEDIMEQIL